MVIPLRAPGKQDAYAVYVLDEQTGTGEPHVRMRTVELGDFLGNLIPIRSGLKEGEKVVVLGAALCADGDLVQVIP